MMPCMKKIDLNLFPKGRFIPVIHLSGCLSCCPRIIVMCCCPLHLCSNFFVCDLWRLIFKITRTSNFTSDDIMASYISSFCSFPSLRQVPAYPNYIKEIFERCLDLYLCPRQKKDRVCFSRPLWNSVRFCFLDTCEIGCIFRILIFFAVFLDILCNCSKVNFIWVWSKGF